MDKARLSMITRAIGIFSAVLLITGCDFWGVNELTVNITSPSGDTTISTGQSVDFESSVSNGSSPYTYNWDFGGGATNSTEQNPGSIIFSTAGTYTVTLTVTDSTGTTAESSVTVTVSTSTSTALTVSITSPSNNTTILPGGLVNFQSTVSNGTGSYTYLWNFDGGATNSTVQDPGSIIFSTTAGTYVVTLTVTDSNNATGEASVNVIVQ
ncbi:MAG: PKD domain-containing protein [Desulfomonilia bacterium]|jgi:PKD repeat protein